jgi:DNA repair photolyase
MSSYGIRGMMIVCASRRTDIPAFHSEWLMNRIRDGYALVRNPVAKNVVHRIDLSPKNVDLLLLMTKDPRPMIPYLGELKERCISIGFQVTITPYGKDIEPGVPDKADIAEAFRTISEIIGKDRMIWRYDPVILNEKFDVNYHIRKFEVLSKELAGSTERCIFSFVEIHEKLRKLEDERRLRNVIVEEADIIGAAFSRIAKNNGMELTLCCSEHDLSKHGISSRGCIDAEDMKKLNVPFERPQVPIRDRCSCVKNIDIGEYDTCDHDCIYCYANRSTGKARKLKDYDTKSEMLFGGLRETDTIVEMAPKKNQRITDF